MSSEKEQEITPKEEENINTEKESEPEKVEEKKGGEEQQQEKSNVQDNNEEEEYDDDDDDDEDETPEDEWIPYHEREEWKDVTPIGRNQVTEYPTPEPPVCPITKNEFVLEVQSYMRAMLNADERSERALKLTQDAIRINKSDFIAWYYRRNILLTLARADLFEEELKFIESVAAKSPKNYQLYYHREAAVSFLQKHMDPEAFVKLVDKDFNWCTSIICEDSKNYHAWSYRLWIVKSFPEAADVAKESRYIDYALMIDPRNNSAWNYRFFIRYKLREAAATQEEILKDVEFVIEKIARSPNNPAPWNYMNSILELREAKGDKAVMDRVKKYAEEACSKYIFCPHCAVLLSDLLKDDSEKEQRLALLVKLRDSIDTIRAKYWDSLIDELTKRT